MTVQPSAYDILRAIQDQQAVQQASFRATERLVLMLAGMLDGSAPDPFVQWNQTASDSEPSPRRIVPSERATPPVEIEVSGFNVLTTERRTKVIRLLDGAEHGLSDLVRKNCAANKKAMSSQIHDINQDFERQGVPLRIEQVGIRNQFRAARYTLRRLDEDATPAIQPSVQSGGEAGERPEEGTPACAAGDGEGITAQGIQSVTSSGAGEGVPAPVDPAPAADEPSSKIAGEPTTINPGPMDGEGCGTAQLGPSTCETPSGAETGSAVEAGAAHPPEGEERPPAVPPAGAVRKQTSQAAKLRDLRLRIEPGDLLAVDVKAREVVTGKGIYHVAGANLARALDALKSGNLFGLDIVAKRAGYHSADVAKQALMLERSRLAQHGVEVWTDRINVRLRAAP